MIRFIVTLLGRWSSRRRAMVAVAATGLGVVLAVLLGLLLDQVRVAAGIALGAVAIGLLYIGVLAAQGLQRRSAEQRLGAGTPLGSADLLLAAGAASEHQHRVDTPAARRVRALQALAAEPWVARGSFEVAAHARSFLAAEVLAAAATRGRMPLERLIDVLASASSVVAIDDLVGPIAGDTGSVLARWLMASPQSEARRAGAVLARLIVEHGGDRAAGDATRLRLAHGLVLHGDHDAARLWLRRLDPHHPDARLLRIDIARAEGELTPEAWMAALAAVFEQAGLEPITLDPTAASPFDGLQSSASPVAHRDDDPLISVVMSCFEPDDSILSAARSIVDQTWSRWELLVMDDASTTADAVLEQVAALDPRIRVIRSDRNTGTYVRRNEAMMLAQGSLITAHDSDDWAHPRRLEVQARHLQANPGLLANVSESLRVDLDLGFAQPRASGLRLTEATIMFRAEPVMSAIGFYDAVRRAADSEFRLRLEAVVGERLPIVRVGAPLTLVRSRADSLSGGDFSDQWMHPARVAYRSAMSHWLRERLDAGRDARIEHPQTERPFPAHPHLTGEPADARAFDLVIVGDMRRSSTFGGNRLAELVRQAGDLGLRVGLRRLEDIARGGAREATAAGLQRLISSGAVVEVIATDAVTASTVIIAGDRCLLGFGERDRAIDAASVRVISESSDDLRAALIADVLPLLVGSAASSAVDVAWASALDGLVGRVDEA